MGNCRGAGWLAAGGDQHGASKPLAVEQCEVNDTIRLSGCLPEPVQAGEIAVRDTKDQGAGTVLRVTANAWKTFTSAIK